MHLATIPPAKLGKSVTPEEVPIDLDEQQQQLINDIKVVNDQIIRLNIEKDRPTLPLGKTCFKSTTKVNKKNGKKRSVIKFRDNKLTDGVHPNNTLRKEWFKLTKIFLEKIINTRTKDSSEETTTGKRKAVESSDSSTSSDSDHGAFKRRKRCQKAN